MAHLLQLLPSLILAKYEKCAISAIGFLDKLTSFRILELEESRFFTVSESKF